MERDKARVEREKRGLERKLAEVTALSEVVKVIGGAESEVEREKKSGAGGSSVEQIVMGDGLGGGGGLGSVAKQLKWAGHVRRSQGPE